MNTEPKLECETIRVAIACIENRMATESRVYDTCAMQNLEKILAWRTHHKDRMFLAARGDAFIAEADLGGKELRAVREFVEWCNSK